MAQKKFGAGEVVPVIVVILVVFWFLRWDNVAALATRWSRAGAPQYTADNIAHMTLEEATARREQVGAQFAAAAGPTSDAPSCVVTGFVQEHAGEDLQLFGLALVENTSAAPSASDWVNLVLLHADPRCLKTEGGREQYDGHAFLTPETRTGWVRDGLDKKEVKVHVLDAQPPAALRVLVEEMQQLDAQIARLTPKAAP